MKLRAQILACLKNHHRIPAAVLGGLTALTFAVPASAAKP